MFLPLAALLAVQPPAQSHLPTTESVTIREGDCYAMVRIGGEVVSTRLPNFHVIAATAGDGRFVANLPEGTGSIACPRSSIIPAPNDWKVLVAGHRLMIMETAPARRVAALDIDEGTFRFGVVSGQLDEAERTAVRARLAQFQRAAAPVQ